LFIASLSARFLARIRLVLDELVRDIKTRRKESTIVLTYKNNNKISWDKLEKKLVSNNIIREDTK
jgi:hypothetical protein